MSESQIIDHFSGNPIRPTDNGLKEGDLPGLSDIPETLELDENGVPVAWTPPEVSDGNS